MMDLDAQMGRDSSAAAISAREAQQRIAANRCSAIAATLWATLFVEEQRRDWLCRRLSDVDEAIAAERAQLAPDAERKLKVLRELGYVNDSIPPSVLERGRVA